MISIYRKRIFIVARLTFVILVGLAFILLANGPALADPVNYDPAGQAQQQVQSIESQAATVKAEMDGLNRELEKVVEEHNVTRVKMDQLTMQLADSRQRLDAALAQRDTQEKMIINRLTTVYKAGDINFISILLNSDSFSDFYEQARYLTKISEQDAKLEQQFRDSADQISNLTEEIDQKRFEQMRLEKDLANQQDKIESGISDRQAKLDQLDGQVKDILAKEAERVKAEQEKAAAENAALMQDLQISDGVQAQVVQTALQYLGVPYVWGGESPSGFDCSGLVKYVYAQYGVALPHASSIQFRMGVPVPPDLLQPGDLVFFYGSTAPQHVGMYIGKGKYVEAPNFGEVVKISNLHFDGDYSGARRYPLQPHGTPVR